MEIIGQARERMHRSGNRQWIDGYPSEADIERDIERGWGFVLCASDDTVVAYGAVVFDGEPTYEVIEQGRGWLTEGDDYVVVHRLAVGDEWTRRGLAVEFLGATERLARERGVGSFRIDTKFSNAPMLGLLAREGFTHCGTITLLSGDTRLAFEKRL